MQVLCLFHRVLKTSILILCSLQDFTVLLTDQFHWCMIISSSVIFLPTSTPTYYVCRLYLRRWFLIPSVYRSEKQKNQFPMVLQTEFASQKKDSRLKYTDGFLFRWWYCNYRRQISVSNDVGECMKYRPNLSVCKVVDTGGSYCEISKD